MNLEKSIEFSKAAGTKYTEKLQKITELKEKIKCTRKFILRMAWQSDQRRSICGVGR